jgi:RNA polymerase sigma-70 factor (ECF subfamily)
MGISMLNTDGSVRRFNQIVRPLLAAVLRTAQFLTRRGADAEDLAQETMLKAFRRLDTLQDESRVRPWLFSILRHALQDSVRSRARRQDEVSLDAVEVVPPAPRCEECEARPDSAEDFWADPDRAMESFSDRQLIAALRGLPKEIRWTLLLVDVEGMDDCDAAQILDVPVGTIKSRAHRGRAMLRAALRGDNRDVAAVRPAVEVMRRPPATMPRHAVPAC